MLLSSGSEGKVNLKLPSYEDLCLLEKSVIMMLKMRRPGTEDLPMLRAPGKMYGFDSMQSPSCRAES